MSKKQIEDIFNKILAKDSPFMNFVKKKNKDLQFEEEWRNKLREFQEVLLAESKLHNNEHALKTAQAFAAFAESLDKDVPDMELLQQFNEIATDKKFHPTAQLAGVVLSLTMVELLTMALIVEMAILTLSGFPPAAILVVLALLLLAVELKLEISVHQNINKLYTDVVEESTKIGDVGFFSLTVVVDKNTIPENNETQEHFELI